MYKRAVGVFCVLTLLMVAAIFRIYYIDMSDHITLAAAAQGQTQLDIADTRGVIYDRNFVRLVNAAHDYIASVLPTPQAATVLLGAADQEERPALLERLSGGQPFALLVEDQNLYADGVDIFKIPRRYSEEQLAPHLIGYLGDDGRVGVAGIERAYDEWLRQTGGEISVRYQIDAVGRAMRSNIIGVDRREVDGNGGVVLTLDSELQQITQEALSAGCEKGAAVVLDIATGDILAMASIPAFDQNDIAASLDSQDAPFINRAISGYDIGSAFKLVTAAAALENGISRDTVHDCQGYIDVEGQIFRCNDNRVHGPVAMERALEVSCNTYFIHLAGKLAEEMEPDYLLTLCKLLGLGSAAELAPGLKSQPGNLPTLAELQSPAAVANFGFGQGSSLATPLQMAQVVATIAGGGESAPPRLVRGLTEDGARLSQQTSAYVPNQILSQKTAGTLKEMMLAVIEEGSGQPARPMTGGAGGKTSSAQTGRMIETPEGERELVHAWFVGFYPANPPRYSIVVFVEGGESGEKVAGPIFKEIADRIALLDR